MLPGSSLIMSMCMKRPFSWGWINKASLSRADKKPARLPARQGVTRLLVANALLIFKGSLCLAPSPSHFCLFLWPSTCSRQYCESEDPALPGTASPWASWTFEKKHSVSCWTQEGGRWAVAGPPRSSGYRWSREAEFCQTTAAEENEWKAILAGNSFTSL